MTPSTGSWTAASRSWPWSATPTRLGGSTTPSWTAPAPPGHYEPLSGPSRRAAPGQCGGAWGRSAAAPLQGEVMPAPRTASVVVIGGGVVGCSIAYQLARRGVRDVVV